MLEEYCPRFVHVAGTENSAADALSRLDLIPNNEDEIDWEDQGRERMRYEDTDSAAEVLEENCYVLIAKAMSRLDFESDGFDDVLNPLASEKEIQNEGFPLSVQLFREEQLNEEALQTAIENDKLHRYTTKMVEGVELVHEYGRIYVPKSLRERVLEWFHIMLTRTKKKTNRNEAEEI